MRRCAYTRCPRLIPNGDRYCDEHRRARDHARGNSTQRGYGSAHQRERARWSQRMVAGSPSKAMGSTITHPSPLTHHPQGWFSSQAPSTATSPYPCNRGRTRTDHRRSNRPQHTRQHPCHNWSHHEHQPPIPQRLAQGTTTQTSTRRIRRVRDLRATSRQNTTHTTPIERRSRRNHPGITRR